MPLKLVRRPVSAKRVVEEVLQEVRDAYVNMARGDISYLEEPISDWDTKPEFKATIKVTRRRWFYYIHVDRRTTAGKRYTWADEGTGSRGGNSDYYIFPKQEGGLLHFEIPSTPKTAPSGPINQLPAGAYYLKSVKHPGIWPRKWTETMLKLKQDRTRTTKEVPAGFRAVSEAAIKRAYRKLGIY